MRKPLMLIPLMLLGGLLPAAAQTLPDAAATKAYAERLLSEQGLAAADGPGLTLLVARGDELLLATARGQASIELGVAMRADHVLRIGSITKQFAAATLLRLVDEGRARLDDPLNRYLPDYPNGAAITLEQLLQHSSGIKDYTSLPGYMGEPLRRELDSAGLIAVFKDQAPDFAPGTRYAYNNSGYVLVGAVVEAIIGLPWHQVLERQLLEPAGIQALRYPAPGRLLAGHVSGYTDGPQGIAPAAFLSMSQAHASGALVGNVESLWRWNRALHEGGLLTPESYRRMSAPSGAAVTGRYGFGLVVDTLRGQRYLHHNGGIHGFFSSLHYLQPQRITVALLRNHDSGRPNLDALGRRLAAYAAGLPYPEPSAIAVDPASLADYAGRYQREGAQRQILLRDGVLMSQRGSSGTLLALTPISVGRFALSGSSAQLQFERDAGGRVSGLNWFVEGDELGVVERWTRQP